MLAGRNVGLSLGSATAMATWVTSNTTMLAPVFALTLGVWGVVAYSTASFGLILFAFFAVRIRVFSATNLHYVLRNLEISSLYVTGVYTNECVETTVRDACDLGYLVTLVEDGCATVTPELHEASLKTLRDRYARIVDAAGAMDEIERNLSPRPD